VPAQESLDDQRFLGAFHLCRRSGTSCLCARRPPTRS
jgi:hypothetical protein